MHEVHAAGPQIVALLLGFNALGQHLQIQFECQVEDGVEDMHRQGIGADHGDKASIYLDVVDFELLQIAQAGVTGAKIIQGNLHAEPMQLFYQLQRGGGGLDQFAFSHLQNDDDRTWFKRLQKCSAIIHQLETLKVFGANIETDMKGLYQPRRMRRE